ncbi:LacI family DNA-binding transcriptional regulator [Myceligenerans xiligouense]|uniref:LacI family transcriptional regulator n=1 Tax=Myceligenerans xiligouense TaxID=253184 RepID=A0A3N4YII2_9MICO|nr:LacI family DNA-binding transcriptional regulator [Myceligenerans xiligouense]RPF20939.1 LacI family transcriptional regulator [Myceligenerans xiligouense]
MGSKRVTLADVARAAGVSPSTASLVMTGRGRELRISEAVHDRVRAAAEDLGYRPNAVSIGLRKGTTRTIGFVSDSVASSRLAGDMIKGAIEAARERGFMLFIGETGGKPAEEAKLVEAMLDHQADGIVLASMFTRSRPLPPDIDRIPAVLLNLTAPGNTTIPSVLPDEERAGREAAELLLAAGHREIHLIGAGPGLDDWPAVAIAARERLRGILGAFDDAGVRPASGHEDPSWLPQQGWEAARRILTSAGPAPLALLCFNDRLAFGAYQAVQETGRSIPDDVSVVSFDDASVAGWLRPGLTTFALPHRALGRRAVELLLEQVGAGADRAGLEPDQLVHQLPMPLRSRESVAPPR